MNRKKKKSPMSTNSAMRVEGYAFKDDVIGVRHLRPDGNDGFNLTLREMVVQGDIKDQGFDAFVTLRDPASGKDDDHLRGTDGYPQFMFISMANHTFQDAAEAANPVDKQCKILHEVRFCAAFYCKFNLFGSIFSPFLTCMSPRLQVTQCTTYSATNMTLSLSFQIKQEMS